MPSVPLYTAAAVSSTRAAGVFPFSALNAAASEPTLSAPESAGEAPTSTSGVDGASDPQAERAKSSADIIKNASRRFICALYHRHVKPSIMTGRGDIEIHKLAILAVCVKIVSVKIGIVLFFGRIDQNGEKDRYGC